jgi:putative ATP-binding cassette transporter
VSLPVIHFVPLQGAGETKSSAGALDAERDWPNVVSGSQRQALAFARLLLANPRFAWVDCPAGVLDASQVERMYAALAQSPITYISVSDHPMLAKYHDLRLESGDNPSWRLGPVDGPKIAR